MRNGGQHRIGPWVVDEELNRLVRDGRQVQLEPRAIDTLLYLLKQRGRTVSRNELLEHVWGKRALTDHAISVVITSLRQALEDDARNPRYLKTVRKKGYCLVEEDDPAPVLGDSSVRQAGGREGVVALASRWPVLLVLLLLGLGFFWQHIPTESEPGAGVGITFEPLQAAVNQDIDKRSLSIVNDLLLMELSRYGKILSAGTVADNEGIAVSGEVAGSGDALRISLTVTTDGQETADYSEPSRADVTYLAKAIRALVSNAFAGYRSAQAEESNRFGQEVLLDRARYFWGFHRDDRNQLAYRMVKQILMEEPRNAEAHALLAEMYAALPGEAWGLEGVNTFDLAEQHIQRAAELGASPKYVWRTRARIAHERDHDLMLAIALYRKSLEVDPDDYWNWRSLAVALAFNQQFGDALDAHDRALSLSLEPTGALSEKMITLYFAGRFEQAAELQKTLEHLDGRPSVRSALIPFMVGDHEKAFRNWQAYFTGMGREDLASVINYGLEGGAVVQTYRRLIDHVEANGQPFPALLKAYIHLLANEVEMATALLTAEFEKHRQRRNDPDYDRRQGRPFLIIRIDPLLRQFEQRQQVRDLLTMMKS